ncbi:MAG: aldo/keto reductase [Thalassobaculum sp.]|uniref:aldo/keto reductase n=1 Tax=Thalassobaculum sp. TaxID=2022740 RepID=UPI0032EF180F
MTSSPDRRSVLSGLIAAGLAPWTSAAAEAAPITRPIPATGERVPAIGMGTWITFNVGDDRELRDSRLEVLRTFFELGGRMVDSSPMYGTAEAVVGHCLARLPADVPLFSATKVWTWWQSNGPEQMAESRRLWGVERFDAMQIHNLLNWEGHMATLAADKAAGRIRLIGITTSHGGRHEEMERIMRAQPVDLVQFTYNIVDREAEKRLLPLAAERGLGVIVNRPFRQKQLFHMFARHPLPGWAGEIGCANWAQFFLKFVISHPAVTCAIPATSRVDHMRQNMGALRGPLPDAAMRRRMVDYVESL